MNKREKTLKRRQKKEKQLKNDYKRRHNLAKYRRSEEVEFKKEVRTHIMNEKGERLLGKNGNPETEVICEKITKRKKKIGQPIEYLKSKKFKKKKQTKKITTL